MTQLLLALALGASTTKLGVYFAGSLDPAPALLAGPGCPAVAVFPLPGDAAAGSQVTTLRSACPQTPIVFQVGGTGAAYSALALSTPSGDWNNTWRPSIPTSARPGDWVEGPTEISGGTAAQLASYWITFAQQVSNSGYLPVVGGLAAGAPPTSDAPAPDGGTENVFCETLRQMASQPRWAWSYHALTPTLDQSASNTALGYRAIAQECMANGAPNATVILTQAGRSAGTWQTADMTWLTWFDRQIGQDATVLGAALYQAGGSTGPSLSSIGAALEAYLQNPSALDGGTDGGSDGGGGVGGGTTPGGPGAPGSLGSPPPSSSCATAGAGAAALIALAPLLLRRRRRR